MSISTTNMFRAQPLSEASTDRLSCLMRHWAWTDEALTAFDRELDGALFDDATAASRLLGTFCRWCALLCPLSEAALDRELLSSEQLTERRRDLEETLPRLRASRQLLVTIPSSFEQSHLVGALAGDDAALEALRLLHRTFGEALEQERMSREIDSLDH